MPDEDLIYLITPAESPLIVHGNIAERTILRYSGGSPKVKAWLKRRARERILNPRYEWIETKPA